MKKQNSTKINNEETINRKTGLSPIQEKAIFSLLSGSKISDVAGQLSIDRSTIYLWQEKENFKAYYNYLKEKIKFETESTLMGLHKDAVQSISESLSSDSDSIRLKAAIWILEEIKSKVIESTNPLKMIKDKCTGSTFDMDFGVFFDQGKYDRLLKENNLRE